MGYNATAEGTLARNLYTIKAHDRELAMTAATLVLNFASPDNYTVIGSPSRDLQAMQDGEFKGTFRPAEERAFHAARVQEVLNAA